jgi:hypothetical protein
MNIEPTSHDELPPPGRYGTMNWMGVAKSMNATDEESTWPRGRAVPPGVGMVVLTSSQNVRALEEEVGLTNVPAGQVCDLPQPAQEVPSPLRRGRGE